MTDIALLKTAALIVASRMTHAGHLAQVVTQEHRGSCTARGCTPACREAADWLVAVEDYLNEMLSRPAEVRGAAGRMGA
jgi:hypothetical protein